MLLVILGAGASYDSSASHRPPGPEQGVHEGRIPMANWLFDVQYNGHVRAAHAERAKPIFNRLRSRRADENIEDLLDDFQSEADTYVERFPQLMAVRYYLRFLVRSVDGPWSSEVGSTNHHTLFDEIRRLAPASEPTLIVTFNYDRMAEWALQDLGELPKVPNSDFSSYVQGRFRLFKAHGSVDWHRPADIPGFHSAMTHEEFVRQVVDAARDVDPRETFHYSGDEQVMVIDGEPVVPAIAVPLRRKQRYEMPQAHESALQQALKGVTRIMCIGWRATDDPFLDLLRQVEGPVYGVVVAFTGADAIRRRLLGVMRRAELWPSDGGFSTFVSSGALTGFLTQAFRGKPNTKSSGPVGVADPFASPAGPIMPGSRGALVIRHGGIARRLPSVLIVATNPYGDDEVRYEAQGPEETVGFLPEHVISFDEETPPTDDPD